MGSLIGVVLYLLVAVVLRRWLVLVVPVVLIPLSYYGLEAGWWGNGAPLDADWWEYAALVTIPFVAFTAALIGIAKLVSRIENGTTVVNLAAGVLAGGTILIIVLAIVG